MSSSAKTVKSKNSKSRKHSKTQKKCKPTQALNPKTGKCLNRTFAGPMWRRWESRPCPAGKVVNPKTGRCVKKTGSIGKKILAKK